MAPRSNRHVNPPAALSAHPAQTWSNRDGRKEMYYVVGTKLSEALYELLIPEHVPIAVTRDSDDRRISIRGTAEQVAAMDRFVEQLTMGEPAYYTGPHPKQTMDYELTKDQAKAMADALDAANRRFSVSRKGATVRVHGDQSLHDAIHDLLQYIRPQRQTMVDISRRSDW